MKERIFLTIVLTFIFLPSISQLPHGLKDGREGGYCAACSETIASRPPEVLFGIDIHQNGDVFFSTTNKEWFQRIFSLDSYGLSAEIISKNRYDCNKEFKVADAGERGHVLKPVYRPALMQTRQELSNGHVSVKIGNLPANMLNQELEGNIIIVNGIWICYYSSMINIDRNVWELLPMGLYSDSLVNTPAGYTDQHYDFFTYDKKAELTVTFPKNKTVYNNADVKAFYDSLQLQDFMIRKIDIRAYASVDGPEKINLQLMKGRADAMVNGLKRYQPLINRVNIKTAENWLEFIEDVKTTSFSNLATLPKAEIKQKLLDRTISDQLEPMLSRHRKAIVTVYLQRKSSLSAVSNDAVLSEFSKAISDRDIQRARLIQKELVSRIADNQLPSAFIDRLEIPFTKEFLQLLNDREIYKFALSRTNAYEALENFMALRQLDSLNGKINYNIASLEFFLWRHDGQVPVQKPFLVSINKLSSQGINPSLVKRMLINYNIMMCGEYMRTYNYGAKDEALLFIQKTYKEIPLNDDDRYSLAKYFTYYVHHDWAEAIVEPRIDKLDVSENLVFYYVNLMFYHPDKYPEEIFRKAMINAINLNPARFCNFFSSNDKGGASIQLLEEEIFRELYCEVCTKRRLYEDNEVAMQPAANITLPAAGIPGE
jgi:hypothetical protein